MTVFEDDGNRRALWRWLGHYGDHIGMVASISGAIAIVLTAAIDSLGYIMVWPVVVLWSAYFVAFAAQDRHMCPRCITDAPVLDPEGAIKRRDRELRAFHGRRRQWLSSALVLIAVAAMYIIPEGAIRSTVYAGTFVLQGMVSAYMLFATNAHRRLHPWCPYCRHGGRGPRAFMIPDPTSPPVVKPQPQNA